MSIEDFAPDPLHYAALHAEHPMDWPHRNQRLIYTRISLANFLTLLLAVVVVLLATGCSINVTSCKPGERLVGDSSGSRWCEP